jgi:uncharacterized membrane protein
MAHSHAHSGSEHPASPRVRRALIFAIVPFVIATIVGLVILWPSDVETPLQASFVNPNRIPATVTAITPGDCEGLPDQNYRCSTIEARLDSGPNEGETVSFTSAEAPQARVMQEGDEIFVAHSPNDPDPNRYLFIDYQRDAPLIVLGLIFAVVVIGLSRLSGVAALAGLAISLVVLVRFVLPAILEGSSPIAVAIVGAAAIMFAALYLTHGVNVRTSTAVLGTLVSLVLTAVLAGYFVDLVRLTGFGSEESLFLQISAGQVNLEGLILGGVIIGTLGVLDDVTITQASAVWELHLANPAFGPRELYRSAVRIGRDHIASTVNTLVLAYAGASLPLLILFTLADFSLGDTFTSEVIAQEVVRTLVGSIGLVASVPITTGLAALVVGREEVPASATRETNGDYKTPRAERAWRES